MKKLKNALIVCLTIVFASMLIILPGCSSGKTEVVIWHPWNVEEGGTEHELKVIVDEFNASQNKIKVVLEQQPNSGFSNKVYTSVANGVGPDIIINFANTLPEYVENNLLADMGKYLNKEEYQSRISETLYEECIGFADEKMHIVPVHVTTPIIFYNKAIYSELNLQAPTSWEEVEANAKKVYEEKNIPGFVADSYTDLAQMLFMQTGSEYINTQTKTVGFNNQDCINQLQWYVDNVNANYFAAGTSYTTGSLEGDFNAGLVASFVGTCSYEPYLVPDAFEYGVAPIPVTGTPWAPIFNRGIIVFGSDEKTESAACKFVEYFTNAENSARWCMSIGALSPYSDANTYNGYTNNIQNNPVLTAAQQTLAYSYTTPAVIGASVVRSELNTAFLQAIGGQKTPTQAIQDAANTCNTALQED